MALEPHLRVEDVLLEIAGKQSDDLSAERGAAAHRNSVVELWEPLGNYPVHPSVPFETEGVRINLSFDVPPER